MKTLTSKTHSTKSFVSYYFLCYKPWHFFDHPMFILFKKLFYQTFFLFAVRCWYNNRHITISRPICWISWKQRKQDTSHFLKLTYQMYFFCLHKVILFPKGESYFTYLKDLRNEISLECIWIQVIFRFIFIILLHRFI